MPLTHAPGAWPWHYMCKRGMELELISLTLQNIRRRSLSRYLAEARVNSRETVAGWILNSRRRLRPVDFARTIFLISANC